MKALIIFMSFLVFAGTIQAQIPQQSRVKKNTSVFTQQVPTKKVATESVTETKNTIAVAQIIAASNDFSNMMIKLPFSTEEKNYMVEKVGHFFVLNGDIIVGNDFPKTQSYSTIPNIGFIRFQWDNATIPIVIDPSIYANGLGAIVHSAISAFNSKTELCLVPRTKEDDYIKISFSTTLGGAAGLSSLGRQGGCQPLFLASTASKGTVLHEVMHAAGFYHEQCRSDRDQFIKIHEENILPGRKSQFQIEPGLTQSTYDYCSIMHYSSMAFSKNGQPTIECAVSGLSVPCPTCLGNRTDFTSKDIQGVDNFYNKVSRFPCNTDFPTPFNQQMQLSTNYPTASNNAIAAFQRSSLLATKENVVGAYPNFHEVRQGNNIVGGTIFLKNGTADWMDIPIAELGYPLIDDFAARMRGTTNYAVQNGYVGGYPNGFSANYGKGVVCGTILIKPGSADWRDVPLSELGNPALDDIGARMRSANDYAARNGYLSGFPTFHHANYGKGIVCGIILIKRDAGEWRDVIIVEGPR